jgi:Na+/proline symporter
MWVYLVVFVLVLIIFGIIARRWIRSISDYFAAGRETSALILALTVSSMMIASTTLYFTPGIAIVAGFWTSFFSVFWAAIGYILMGLTLGIAIRRSGIYTLPEMLETRFGSKTRLVGMIVTLVALWAVLEAQIFGLGNILSVLLNIPYPYAALGSTVIYLAYLFLGGVWAAWIAGLLMGVIILTALPISWAWLSVTYGGWGTILSRFSEIAMLDKLGGGWGFLFPGMLTLLAMWILIPMGDQANWFKCVAGRSERHVKIGHIFAGIIIALFFTAGLSVYGYYALAMYPGEQFDPFASFPMVVMKMPPALGGYMLLLLLSASFSTAGPIILGAGQVIIRDIYGRFLKPEASLEELVLPSRIVVVVFGFITLVTALSIPWVTWYALSIGAAFMAPILLPIVLGLIWKRVTATSAAISIPITAIILLIWIILGYDQTILHPIWLGLAISFLLLVIISFFTEPIYYAKTSFEDARKNKPLKAEDLSKNHLKILDAVRKGTRTLSNIVDTLALDGGKVHRLVEELEINGYLKREGYTGFKLFNVSLTKKGKEVIDKLSPLSDDEKELVEKLGIGKKTLEILSVLKQNPRASTLEISDRSKIDPVNYIAHAELLESRGWIKRSGILRQIVIVTDEGNRILNEYSHILGGEK